MYDVVLRTDMPVEVIDKFLKIPEIYYLSSDDLVPSPEEVDFTLSLQSENRLSFGIFIADNMVGHIQYVRRNAILCEVHAGFLKGYGGKLVKKAGEATLDIIFNQKHMLKVIACIPADNKAARLSIRQFGFEREGVLTKAILRGGALRDIIIYGLSKDARCRRSSIRQ